MLARNGQGTRRNRRREQILNDNKEAKAKKATKRQQRTHIFTKSNNVEQNKILIKQSDNESNGSTDPLRDKKREDTK